jgi:hypothetical protein
VFTTDRLQFQGLNASVDKKGIPPIQFYLIQYHRPQATGNPIKAAIKNNPATTIGMDARLLGLPVFIFSRAF